MRKPRETLPEWRTIMLHGCGHIPTWDDPGQVARTLLLASTQAAHGSCRHGRPACPPAYSHASSPTCARPGGPRRWPPGELSFSVRRTREFESEPLPLLLRMYETYGPVFTMRLLYLPVVFALGPEANHYITVSNASNFRWREGSMGDLIPLLGDGLLTTDGTTTAAPGGSCCRRSIASGCSTRPRSWSRRPSGRSRRGGRTRR